MLALTTAQSPLNAQALLILIERRRWHLVLVLITAQPAPSGHHPLRLALALITARQAPNAQAHLTLTERPPQLHPA